MTLPPWPLADYELMAAPSLTDAQLGAIIDRHGLAIGAPITRIGASGVVHALWALGDDFVLRVPKDEEMCLGDHRCEAAAIPLALAAGVRTPTLIVHDDSLDLLDVPYSIVERIHGSELRTLPADDARHDDLYRQLGEQLAILHRAPAPSTPHPALRTPDASPAESYFDEVMAAGALHADGIEWLRRLCDRLDERIGDTAAPRVFLHNDVKPDNAMVDADDVVHVIDWGDAGYGDPVYDFHSLPLRATRAALDGYRATMAGDPTLEARVLRRVVARSVSALRRTPLLGPSWYRPTAATLTDLLTFAVDHPDVWRSWVG